MDTACKSARRRRRARMRMRMRTRMRKKTRTGKIRKEESRKINGGGGIM